MNRVVESLQYQSCQLVGLDLRRSLVALKRLVSSLIVLIFSSSCIIFELFDTSVLRSLSSALPTESLAILAIVDSSARGIVHLRARPITQFTGCFPLCFASRRR